MVRARRTLPAMDRRTDAVELLDGPLDDPAALVGNLRDLRRVNRWLGGVTLSAGAIDALAAHRHELTLLDVGTGGADIPLALLARATARGRGLSIVGIDSRPEVLAAAVTRHAELAVTDGLELHVGDGRSLPYPDRSFDVVHASLVIHHCTPAEAVTLMREMGRVARLGVVVNDLDRTAARLDRRLAARPPPDPQPVYAHTTRRSRSGASYARDEMAEMLRTAGLTPVRTLRGAVRPAVRDRGRRRRRRWARTGRRRHADPMRGASGGLAPPSGSRSRSSVAGRQGRSWLPGSRAAGREVVVLERSPAWSWRAGGVFTSPAAVAALRRAGLDPATLAAVARPIPAMRVETPVGTTFRLTYGTETGGEPAVGFDRSRLDPALLELAADGRRRGPSRLARDRFRPRSGRLEARDRRGPAADPRDGRRRRGRACIRWWPGRPVSLGRPGSTRGSA